MEEIHEVTYRRDGKNWIRVCESHNPERVQRNVLDALLRKYVCHSKSITRIVKKHYCSTGRNHITVYYSKGFKSVYWL